MSTIDVALIKRSGRELLLSLSLTRGGRSKASKQAFSISTIVKDFTTQIFNDSNSAARPKIKMGVVSSSGLSSATSPTGGGNALEACGVRSGAPVAATVVARN